MRILAILVAVFGIALAGGAIFFASEYFKQLNATVATQKGPETVRVLVAKRALSYGAAISPKDLQWVEWPKAAVPPGAFTKVEDLFGAKGNEKRIVLRSIEPGEPILEGKITKLGESPRMSMNLEAGKRAVSIQVDAVSGVAGFVAPGDRVDIILTRTLDGQLVSSVILQDIVVIAVDQLANAETASPRLGRTVTVEVDVKQAQKLALAQQVGRLSLTLRGLSDAAGQESGADTGPVTVDELNGIVRKEDPALKVRVRRAGSLDEVRIDDGASRKGGTTQGNAAPAPSAN